MAGFVPEDVADRVDNARALLEIGRRTRLEVFSMSAKQQLALCALELGDLDEMRRVAPKRSDNAGALNHLWSGQLRVMSTFLDGDLASAEAHLVALRPLADMFGPSTACRSGSLLTIRAYQGRDARSIPRLEEQTTLSGIGAIIDGLLTQALARHGRGDDARARLDARAQHGFADVPRNVGWVNGARRASVRRQPWWKTATAATCLLSLLEPLAGRLACTTENLPHTSIDFVRAALTLVVGDVGGAEKIAAAAVDASRRRGTVLFLGRELVLLADCRRRLGAPDGEVEALLG